MHTVGVLVGFKENLISMVIIAVWFTVYWLAFSNWYACEFFSFKVQKYLDWGAVHNFRHKSNSGFSISIFGIFNSVTWRKMQYDMIKYQIELSKKPNLILRNPEFNSVKILIWFGENPNLIQ